jgi:hypothetical protein
MYTYVFCTYMYTICCTQYIHVCTVIKHVQVCMYILAEVMEQLDAARDELLDKDDGLVGLVKDVEEVKNCLRDKLLPRNAWHLIPFFELFMCAPKDELHQW